MSLSVGGSTGNLSRLYLLPYWDGLQLPAILKYVGWMMDVWRMTVAKVKQYC